MSHDKVDDVYIADQQERTSPLIAHMVYDHLSHKMSRKEHLPPKNCSSKVL